jgi:hypothetical protein|nr:MAG TPA: hypothetical protein [Caudoviricetes sp.]
MQTPKSRVYVLLDSESRVLRLEGEYSLPADLAGWTKIDEGFGDKYALAQSLYLGKPLYDGAIPRYKLVDGKVVERTAEEIEADKAKLPKPVNPKTNAELESENANLKQQVSALVEQQSFYEDCIAEMAAVVYA